MRVWTIANQKGGVGKTTTAVSLGGLLASRDRRTLLLDLDPHGSMTSYFGHDPDSIDPSAYTLFQRFAEGSHVPLAAMFQHTEVDNLDLLPASTALVALDRQFGSRGGMGLVIRRALEAWRSQYAHVLIDCPPMLGILMVNALACCQRVIVPVQTEFLALKGLERLLHTLQMIAHGQRLEVPITVVPTMFDQRTRASTQSLRWLQEHHARDLWSGVIPIDTRFRDASRIGWPLPLLKPDARGAVAYRHLLTALDEMSDAELRKAG
jgi:chromosome partitioning protein